MGSVYVGSDSFKTFSWTTALVHKSSPLSFTLCRSQKQVEQFRVDAKRQRLETEFKLYRPLLALTHSLQTGQQLSHEEWEVYYSFVDEERDRQRSLLLQTLFATREYFRRLRFGSSLAGRRKANDTRIGIEKPGNWGPAGGKS